MTRVMDGGWTFSAAASSPISWSPLLSSTAMADSWLELRSRESSRIWRSRRASRITDGRNALARPAMVLVSWLAVTTSSIFLSNAKYKDYRFGCSEAAQRQPTS